VTIVDAEFRKTEKCTLCEDPIGDEDFAVLCLPERAEWRNGHVTAVSKCLEMQHVRCRKAWSDAFAAYAIPHRSE
jgi:hypothetical protein